MPVTIIFETKRLIIRSFKKLDTTSFFDMMGNPNVTNPIPVKALSKKESDNKLLEFIDLHQNKSEKKIWAIQLRSSNDLIGLCGLIINNKNNNEIAYRFREKFWGLGYGTEIAKGLIDYGFYKLNYNLITADAYIRNSKSIKIIEKFMSFDKEFFNPNDNCIDRRYQVTKKEWQLKSAN